MQFLFLHKTRSELRYCIFANVHYVHADIREERRRRQLKSHGDSSVASEEVSSGGRHVVVGRGKSGRR